VCQLTAVLRRASRVPRQRATFEDVVTPIVNHSVINDYNREAEYDDEDGFFNEDRSVRTQHARSH
jgi:hypothetical protein